MQNHTNMGFPAPEKSPSTPPGAEAGKGEEILKLPNLVVGERYRFVWVEFKWVEINGQKRRVAVVKTDKGMFKVVGGLRTAPIMSVLEWMQEYLEEGEQKCATVVYDKKEDQFDLKYIRDAAEEEWP